MTKEQVLQKLGEIQTIGLAMQTGNESISLGDGIELINNTIPLVISWIREEKWKDDKSSDEIISRNEELGEEVRDRNRKALEEMGQG